MWKNENLLFDMTLYQLFTTMYKLLITVWFTLNKNVIL
jgi:hypothetical protein